MFYLIIHAQGPEGATVIRCLEHMGGGIKKYFAKDEAISEGNKIFEKTSVLRIDVLEDGNALPVAVIKEAVKR